MAENRREHVGNCMGDVLWVRPRNGWQLFFPHFIDKNSYLQEKLNNAAYLCAHFTKKERKQFGDCIAMSIIPVIYCLLLHVCPYMYFYVYKSVVFYISQAWLGYAAVIDNLNISAYVSLKIHMPSTGQRSGSVHPRYSGTQTDGETKWNMLVWY